MHISTYQSKWDILFLAIMSINSCLTISRESTGSVVRFLNAFSVTIAKGLRK